MRRKSSLILLVAAVFCVALAPLLREFVFPRVVAKGLAGGDAYRVVVLDADDATLLGAPEGTGKARITAIQTVRPNAKESRDGTVVWDMHLAILDSTGKVVTSLPERYAFDAATQIPKNCCGESIDGEPAAHTGIAYKWPFFTHKRDYNYYDSQAHVANVISYKGTEDRGGLETYRFEQEVPWTKIPLPGVLPGGLDPIAIEKQGLQLWYTATRKVWVDPITGSPVYMEEGRKVELRTSPPADDPEAVPTVTPVFEGTFKPRPEYAAALAADAEDQGASLRLLHDTMPVALVVVGIVLFLIALGLQFVADRKLRPRRAGPSPSNATNASKPEPATPDTPKPAAVPSPRRPAAVRPSDAPTTLLPSVPATDTEPEPRPEPEPTPERDPESNAQPAPDADAKPKPKPKPKPVTEADPTPDPVAEAVPGAEPGTEPAPKSHPEADPKPHPAPATPESADGPAGKAEGSPVPVPVPAPTATTSEN